MLALSQLVFCGSRLATNERWREELQSFVKNFSINCGVETASPKASEGKAISATKLGSQILRSLMDRDFSCGNIVSIS